jgi:peptide/nickel transport system permease protein
MGTADVQLTIPSILIALMINGGVVVVLPPEMRAPLAVPVLIAAIGVSDWLRDVLNPKLR